MGNPFFLPGLFLLLIMLLLFGCFGPAPEKPSEKPVSEDAEVSIIAGENYSLGEPIAFQLKTVNYSIIYLNRSGGYLAGSYPSAWICRQTNESCINVEYRHLKDFSRCSGGTVNIDVPAEGGDAKEIWPAENYGLLLLWDQKEWSEERISCGNGAAQVRKQIQVPAGNYSITFVYWVSWDKNPRSVSADFRIA
jgi:hypothetical protein